MIEFEPYATHRRTHAQEPPGWHAPHHAEHGVRRSRQGARLALAGLWLRAEDVDAGPGRRDHACRNACRGQRRHVQSPELGRRLALAPSGRWRDAEPLHLRGRPRRPLRTRAGCGRDDRGGAGGHVLGRPDLRRPGPGGPPLGLRAAPARGSRRPDQPRRSLSCRASARRKSQARGRIAGRYTPRSTSAEMRPRSSSATRARGWSITRIPGKR